MRRSREEIKVLYSSCDIDIIHNGIRFWGGEMQKDGCHNVFQEMWRILSKRKNLKKEDITVKVKERCGGLEK